MCWRDQLKMRHLYNTSSFQDSRSIMEEEEVRVLEPFWWKMIPRKLVLSRQNRALAHMNLLVMAVC